MTTERPEGDEETGTVAGMDADAVKQRVHALDAVQLDSMPLYMTSLPEDAEANAALSAIQALLHEGTPVEQASNFKHQGNECYALGPQGWRDAVQFYTRGLQIECGDAKLDAMLHMNRAAAELGLERWSEALQDAKRALELDTEAVQVKAHSRIIKAAIPLGKAEEARRSVWALEELGVAIDEAVMAKLVELEAQIAAEERRRREAEAALKRIRDIIGDIGVQVVAGSERAILDHFGPNVPVDALPTVHRDAKTKRRMWPVVLLYPSAAQSDILHAVDEGCTMSDLLEMVFSEAPEWDTARKYASHRSLRVLWHDHAKDRLVQIKPSRTISDMLGKLITTIERGILAFYVCPEGPDCQALIQRFPPDRVDKF